MKECLADQSAELDPMTEQAQEDGRDKTTAKKEPNDDA
jgi:hypothetical protein